MGIRFGGDYNPEQWPEEVWAEDLELMKAAHVTMVTAGIFSWAKVEPRPGEWDFGWFDRVLDGLAGAGIEVCLATMTASPPPWLSRAHPEILPEGPDGQRRWPGARQHFCPSSPVFRAHAVRLVEQLATRYADHPALAMWHVGNEYGCHTRQCFCDVSAQDFRRWLRERYGTVAALNDAWSTSFWSQAYGDFAEVLPPRTAPTFANPAQQLDYLRFGDQALKDCYLAERAVLDRLTPGVPVTTNLMPQHKPVDAFGWAPSMDVVALDFYQDPYVPDDHVRAGYVFDLMRSARGGQPWLLLEQAAGAVNWRPRNGPKPPGAMRLWSWQAVAQGADAVLFFQWRQSRGGAEKFHSAMLPHGGTDTRIFREVCELGRELAAVPGIEGARSRASVALLADWQSWWALELDSRPSAALDHSHGALVHYRPLFEAGVACDVVPPDRDLTPYPMVVVPNLYLLTADHAARLAAYVRGGGHLVVSFFSGIVDACDRVHPGGYPGPLRELLGLRVAEFWPLAEGASVAVGGTGAHGGRADLWTEEIVPAGAEVVARFLDGELAGRPAVTRHDYGRGTAWYLGTRLEPALLRALLDDVRAAAGVAPVLPGLPAGVQATVREGAGGRYVFLLNHGCRAVEVPLPEPLRDALAPRTAAVTRVELAARGVAVLTGPGPEGGGGAAE
ncbi:beta-galactosidase [Streptomyces noursei]|uniref:beta-galactosidase n=1 Tax=Streptomyces noursei TaxID=1971 RepID=UPI0016797C91|nr:beta-galactosidase [Streptomyces noursei]MCZ1016258.1 beta-galactosidase [Streptomyces noursei]GGX01018.1 beta-galactosidase [Streptomyces noursei]